VLGAHVFQQCGGPGEALQALLQPAQPDERFGQVRLGLGFADHGTDAAVLADQLPAGGQRLLVPA